MAIEFQTRSTSLAPPRNKNGKIRLPSGFLPESNSVICGRGKACTTATGNHRLRAIVEHHLNAYSEAKTKVEKSSIVSKIMEATKQGKVRGCFVRYEEGAWWEVDESVTREKVGSLLRDCLHTQYRSSTKSKLARRKARKMMINEGSSSPLGFSEGFDTAYRLSLSSMFEFGTDIEKATHAPLPTMSQMYPSDSSNYTNLYHQQNPNSFQPSHDCGSNGGYVTPPTGGATTSLGTQPQSLKNYYSLLSNYMTPPLVGVSQQENAFQHSNPEGSTSMSQFNAVRQAYSLVQDNWDVVYDDDFPDDLSDIFDD
jgi:hypothetical protein